MIASQPPGGRFGARPCASLDAASVEVERVSATRDVWYGLGLLASPPRGGRGRAEDVVQIGGMWADLDMHDGTGAHKVRDGQKLPTTPEEALSALDGVVPTPSVVVHSGHGLQVYWLGASPWRFGPGDPKPARMAVQWHDALKQAYAARGWHLDSTFDLARVFRVPGTHNRKATPVAVRILSPTGDAEPIRYEWDDLRAVALEGWARNGKLGGGGKVAMPAASTGGNGKVGVSKRSVASRIKAICDEDKAFALVWRKLRKATDQTSSAYHLSIASRLVRYPDWSDVEIVEAWRLWNAKHGVQSQKLERTDYLDRTLRKARASIRGETVHAERPETPEEVQVALESLRAALGLPVVQIVRMTGDPSLWQFHLDDGQAIHLTGPQVSRGPQPMRGAALDLGVRMGRFKGAEWDQVVDMFLGVAESVESGTEATTDGTLRSEMDSFQAANQNATVLDEGHAAPDTGSFVRTAGGHHGLNFALRDYLTFLYEDGVRLTRPRVVQWLRSAGLEDYRARTVSGSQRRVWVLSSNQEP